MKKLLMIVLLLALAALLPAGCSGGSDETSAEVPMEPQQVAKLDASRSWVYDAPLAYDIITPSTYTTMGGVSVAVRDLVVPFVNIDSAAAREVNLELGHLGQELLHNYTQNAADAIFYELASYKSYEYRDFLSLLTVHEQGGTNVPAKEFAAYVFDLRDGSRLDFAAICAFCGLSEADLDRRVQEKIGDYLASQFELDEEQLAAAISASCARWQELRAQSSAQAYLNESGQLYLALPFVVEAVGDGEFSELLACD